MRLTGRVWFWLGACILTLAHLALAVVAAREDSQTNDEAAHLAAGYSYWVRHDWRLNPEHPPLSKLVAAAPLLVMGLDFAPSSEAWAQADEFAIGRQFVYHNQRPAQTILFAARLPTIAFTAMLLGALAFVGLRCFGGRAGLLAVAAAAFDPGLLAHGHYVTSDVPVTLFFFAAPVAWFGWLSSGGRRRLVLTAVLAGLALATKFSAVLLAPAFLCLWIVRRRRVSWRRAAVLGGVPLLVVWAVYGFSIQPPASDPRIGAALAAKAQWANVPVPAYYFFRGLHLQMRHARGGHTAYLLGQLSRHGFRWYFPVAFAVKTPLGILAAVVVSVFLLVRRGREWLWLLVPAGVYFLASVGSPLNIGIRHLLTGPCFSVRSHRSGLLRGERTRCAGGAAGMRGGGGG